MKRLIILLKLLIFLGGMHAQNNMEISWQNCFGGSNYEDDANILKTDFGYFILSTTNSQDEDITNYWGEDDIWLTAIDNTGNLLWGRSYGGTSIDLAKNIISDEFGFYYFGGWTASNDGDVQSGNHGGFDRWIVKINSNGKIIWEKCYGGTRDDYGPRLKMSSNGNVIAFSASNSSDGDVPINYGFLDVWITIIDPQDGGILKNKVFGNIGHNNIFDIVETQDGGFFLTSKAQEVEGMVQGNFKGVCDVWAVKTDSNFNIEWQKLYGGSSIDYQGRGLLELNDGYIFLAQTISNSDDVSGFHGIVGDESTYDTWVVRIDTVGNIIWQKCLGGSDYEYGRSIIANDDGGFVVFATTDSDDGDVLDLHTTYNHQNSDIWMIKLSASGDIEWSKCYGSINSEWLSYDAVVKNNEDNYTIIGWTYYGNTGDVSCNLKGKRDLWLFETKDCDNYMPQVPIRPIGPDTLYITTDSIALYATNPVAGAWNYEWQVLPQEAGTFYGDSTNATLHWSNGWEGQAQISVRSWNDCGYSEWSEVKNTWAFSCLGIGDNPYHNLQFEIFPNPASSKIHCQLTTVNCQFSMWIYDIFGRKQDEIEIPKGQQETSINISSYSPGVYVAVLKNDESIVARRKFVKN